MTTGTGASGPGVPDLSYLSLGADPASVPGMSMLNRLASIPVALLNTTEIMLTVEDAVIAATPKEVVWTHRKTTLYRYHSANRKHPIPILLVFALINRPHVYDLRPGNSFVEFLLEEGYDVFLVDWGVPGEEDDDLGVADYVCDELHWAVRETLRASGQEQLSLVGWCIGATLTAMYTAIHADLGQVRNLVVLTMPIDTTGSVYETWVEPGDLRRRHDHLQRRRPRRNDRHRQPDAQADHQLRHHPAQGVRPGARGLDRPGGLPVHVEVGAGQPAVPGPVLPRLDHLDVQGEPAGQRHHAAARPAGRLQGHRRTGGAARHRQRRPHRPPLRHHAVPWTWSAPRT